MTRDQAELMKKATFVAESKVRQARAMQAVEARAVLRAFVTAIAARLRRNKTGETAET